MASLRGKGERVEMGGVGKRGEVGQHASPPPPPLTLLSPLPPSPTPAPVLHLLQRGPPGPSETFPWKWGGGGGIGMKFGALPFSEQFKWRGDKEMGGKGEGEGRRGGGFTIPAGEHQFKWRVFENMEQVMHYCEGGASV